MVGLNRFSVRFGSKTWKKIISIWLFILAQNRTEPEIHTPTFHMGNGTRDHNKIIGKDVILSRYQNEYNIITLYLIYTPS